MKKRNLIVVTAFSLVFTFTNCVTKSSNSNDSGNQNDKDSIFVWLLDHSVNDSIPVLDAESNVVHSSNPEDYSIIVLDRTGPNVDEHCDPSVLANVLYGEYSMQIPSSYNESQILKALVDSIIQKRPLPIGVSLEELNND